MGLTASAVGHRKTSRSPRIDHTWRKNTFYTSNRSFHPLLSGSTFFADLRSRLYATRRLRWTPRPHSQRGRSSRDLQMPQKWSELAKIHFLCMKHPLRSDRTFFADLRSRLYATRRVQWTPRPHSQRPSSIRNLWVH